MSSILVTGGSGFIGTNLIESFLSAGHEVLNIDIKGPKNSEHYEVFKKIDILDRKSLSDIISDFMPEQVVHLAARTDLHEKKDLDGYSVNTLGVKNMVHAVSNQSSVKKCIFASTKLVCPTDYTPKSDNDYCPNTLYGKSKVVGEDIVKNSTTMKCDWCIIRPTSIWGPGSDSPNNPYGKFFKMVASGWYFHPGNINSQRSYGYVRNGVFQIIKLLEAPREQIHGKVFYMTDYDVFSIKDWANVISLKTRNKKVPVIPEPFVILLSWCGDLMKLCGIKEPPFSTFRLRNMRADTTGVPMEPIKQITGPLPYSMEQGVEETIEWFKNQGLI